jgi:hypothetical protein
MMMIIKAGVLVLFAMAASGPMGVSFGQVWTAILKFAAIAVLCDGICVWVDAFADNIGGVALRSFSGWGVLSFPVALGLYWSLFIYLFDMDSGDSWQVVLLLTAVDRLVKMILVFVLLQIVLGWGGVSGASLPSFGGGSGGSMAHATEDEIDALDQAKQFHRVIEARQYIKDGHQAAMSGLVESLYTNGCTNVWYEVDRDINGRATPEDLLIELPKNLVKDKDKRDKCFDAVRTWEKNRGRQFNADAMKDTGQLYIHAYL